MDNALLKKLSILPMRLHDIVLIQRIDQKNAMPWPFRYYFKILTSPNFFTNIAWIKKNLVGNITYHLVKNVMHIDKILVDNSYQQWGIGGKLLEHSILEAHKKGAQNVCLNVSLSNKSAINFYSKHQFTIETIKPDYYSKNDDGLNMIRVL